MISPDKPNNKDKKLQKQLTTPEGMIKVKEDYFIDKFNQPST